MADPTTVRLLLFRVGALLGAAEVEDVAEILPRLETTRIPGAMPFVAGLVNVRGTLVTVVTGWRALGQPDGGADAGASVVLLRLQGGRRLIGLSVDEVVDLVTVAREDLRDRAVLPGVDPVLVRAVGRRGSGSYIVLDTAALFAPVLAS